MPLEGQNNRPQENGSAGNEAIRAKTNAELSSLKEMLVQNRGADLMKALMSVLDAKGEIPEQRMDTFLQSLNEGEKKQLFTLFSTSKDSKEQGLVNRLLTLERGNGTLGMEAVGDGARKMLGYIDKMTANVKDNPQLASILDKFGIKAETGGVQTLFMGLAAKFLESLSKSLKGLGGAADQLLITARDLRVTQLKKSKKVTKDDIETFVKGYDKWMEGDRLYPAPDTVAKAANLIKKPVAPAATPAQTQTAQTQPKAPEKPSSPTA